MNALKDTVTCFWCSKSCAVCLTEQLSHNHKRNSSEVYFFSNLHLVFLLLFCNLCFESTFPCQQRSGAREVRHLPPTVARIPHRLPTRLPTPGWSGGAGSSLSEPPHHPPARALERPPFPTLHPNTWKKKIVLHQKEKTHSCSLWIHTHPAAPMPSSAQLLGP